MRIFATLLAVVFVTTNANAQEPTNPYRWNEPVQMKPNPDLGDRGYLHREYHQDFTRWHNQMGTHCCGVDAEQGNGDCRVTIAEYNYDLNAWEALVDGTWRLIAPDRHIQERSAIPHAVVCAGQYGTIYCFKPGYSGS